MKFTCKNLPLEHEGDVSCPHCTIAMRVNDWMLSIDAREYIAEMERSAPKIMGKFPAEDEKMAIAMVGGLSIVLANLITATGNPLLQGYLEAHAEQCFAHETQRLKTEGGF
jgi:uncharacterized Zn finger protein (UPF0148 family)